MSSRLSVGVSAVLDIPGTVIVRTEERRVVADALTGLARKYQTDTTVLDVCHLVARALFLGEKFRYTLKEEK